MVELLVLGDAQIEDIFLAYAMKPNVEGLPPKRLVDLQLERRIEGVVSKAVGRLEMKQGVILK